MATGLSGLASGVDTASIVDQLMALERQTLTKHTYRQRAITAEQTALRDIRTKLTTLRTAADALRGPGAWGDVQTVSSSDPAKVAVTQPVGMLPPSSVAIKVNALATGAQTRYGTWTPPAAETKLWLSDGVGVTLAAGATVQDAASAINATGKLVYAGVVDGKLVLTSRETGETAAVPELRTGDGWAAGSPVAGVPVAVERTIAGTDADITVNGATVRQKSNEFWLADQGLQITLRAPTATEVTVSATAPAVDKAAIKDKLKAFVDAYNAVVTAVNAKTTEKRVVSPATAGEAERGALFGDSALTGILSALRKGVSQRIPGLDDPATTAVGEPDELFDIGISTGKGAGGASSADAKLGKLVIDDAKLDAALGDPLAVKALFAGRGATAGFSAAIDDMLSGWTKADGALDNRIKGADTRLQRIRDQVVDAEERIAAKEKRYKAQFAAMEKAMGLAQSQSAWLAGQIAGLASQQQSG